MYMNKIKPQSISYRKLKDIIDNNCRQQTFNESCNDDYCVTGHDFVAINLEDLKSALCRHFRRCWK